jgi:hypothetical protein
MFYRRRVTCKRPSKLMVSEVYKKFQKKCANVGKGRSAEKRKSLQLKLDAIATN